MQTKQAKILKMTYFWCSKKSYGRFDSAILKAGFASSIRHVMQVSTDVVSVLNSLSKFRSSMFFRVQLYMLGGTIYSPSLYIKLLRSMEE